MHTSGTEKHDNWLRFQYSKVTNHRPYSKEATRWRDKVTIFENIKAYHNAISKINKMMEATNEHI